MRTGDLCLTLSKPERLWNETKDSKLKTENKKSQISNPKCDGLPAFNCSTKDKQYCTSIPLIGENV
jgi:hypothetical protein